MTTTNTIIAETLNQSLSFLKASLLDRAIGAVRSCGFWTYTAIAITFLLPIKTSFGQQTLPEDVSTVRLDASGQMELKLLVNYVAERTGLQFVIDPSIEQKKVKIVATEPIPVASLLPLLQLVLRNEGLAIVEASVEGWKRIVPINRIPPAPSKSQSSNVVEFGTGEPVTRVFLLKNLQPSKIADLVKQTIAQPEFNLLPVDDQRILIVTDIAENIRRIAQLIELLDTGKPTVDIKFVPVKHVKASELEQQLNQLLQARSRVVSGAVSDQSSSPSLASVQVEVEQRTNQLILIGHPLEIEAAEKLLEKLDRALPTSIVTLSLSYTSPEQLDSVLKSILDGRTVRPPFQSRIEGNSLVIESTDEILKLAQQVRTQIDTREAPESQSPIRFYKVKNVAADEVLQTIQSIFGHGSLPQRRTLPEGRRYARGINQPMGAVPWAGGFGPTLGNFGNPILPYGTGMSAGGNFGLGGLGSPGTGSGSLSPGNLGQGLFNPQRYQTPPNESASMEMQRKNQSSDTLAFDTNTEGSTSSAASMFNSLPSDFIGEAKVSVDIHTNSIIVVAKPEVQRVYASLIEKLDQRRPQVLVEARIVIIDTKDDFVFGVEVSGGDRSDPKKLFAFTSYGFSTVDPTSGALKILPGIGFNGTLVDPSTADVVVKALTTHRRARVLSSPRILVNDNAEGELTSVLEVPFTSVNSNLNVATTTFGGFAEAGTTINVTPTISDNDHLQLDYTVTLNTFTGAGSAGIPPPRQTNEVRSRVTVPDGYTVIVGGLTSKNDIIEYRGLPWLEKVPVIRELTGHTKNDWSEISMFVFLRPVILRDDKFLDLKYISNEELCDACLPGQYPQSLSKSIP